MPVVELFLPQVRGGPLPRLLPREPILGESTGRWPWLAPLATRCGYRAAHALPLRVRQQTIGALNLLLTTLGGLPDTELSLAQSLADVAAVALTWSPLVRSASAAVTPDATPSGASPAKWATKGSGESGCAVTQSARRRRRRHLRRGLPALPASYGVPASLAPLT
jgi:hypothetical protein